MTRTTVEIDENDLEAAQRELGTSTMKDTINAALRAVAQRGARTQSLIDEANAVTDERLLRIGVGQDIGNPEIMAQARR